MDAQNGHTRARLPEPGTRGAGEGQTPSLRHLASSDIATSDHPHGRAIDVMIADYHDPSQIALGDRVSDFLIANHASLKIKYIIWQQKIWTPTNPTWRPMADRGSDVANHLDHVHVSVAE